MTLFELRLIKHSIINRFPIDTDEEVEEKVKILFILNREINIRTIDPRKEKE
jgi:hypothetical protein